jgi:hypothetical protein
LIVTEDGNLLCQALLHQDDKYKERLLFATAPSLGDLRNVSVWHARGELVAHWDDDDLSAPTRLAEQVDHLLSLPHAKASMLSRITLDWKGERQGLSVFRPWECTLVAKKKTLGTYPSLPRGEDSPVAHDGIFVLLDRPDLYTRRFHGNNTWDEAHHRQLWADK